MAIKQCFSTERAIVLVLTVIGLLSSCGTAAAQNAKAKNIRYRSTKNQFRDVDAEWLSGWLRRFGVDLPDDIQGKVTTNIEIQWPFGALTDPKQYRIRANVESKRLKVGPLALGDVEADIDYRNGVAVLRSLSFDLLEDTTEGFVVRGHVDGRATAQLLPLDEITLDIEFDDVSATYIANELGIEVPELTGNVSGKVTAKSDFANFRAIKGWQAEGTVSGEDLSALGRPKTQLRDTKLVLNQGKLELEKLVAETEGGLVTADGEIDLADIFPWKLETRLEGFELSEATKWANADEIDASGKVTGKLDLTGTADPFVWKAQGELETKSAFVEQIRFANGKISLDASGKNDANSLRAKGRLGAESVGGPALGRGRIDTVTAEYQLSGQLVELTDIRGQVGDGTLLAKATWPFSDEGTANADGRWQDVDFGPFLLSSTRRQDLSILAKSNGDFRWSAPVKDLEDLSQHKLTGKARIPNVVVNGKPSGKLDLEITQSTDPPAAGQVQYKLTGDLFGGTIEGSGTLASLRDQTSTENADANENRKGENQENVTTNSNLSDLETSAPDANATVATASPQSGSAPIGNLQLKDLDLGLFTRTVLRGMDRVWQGRLSLSARIGADGKSQGQLEIERLRYVDTLISDSLKGEFTADAKQVFLKRISGRVLGGRLSSQGRIDYSGRGQLAIRLIRVDTQQAAQTIYPWLKDYFAGPVNVSLRASGNGSWRATGTLTGFKNKIGVFEVQRLRAPVVLTLSPSGTISLESRDIRGSLAKGQIAGKGKVVSRSSGIDLASQWKFSRVGIQSIENALGGSGAIATGDMSGTMTLHGKRMHAFRDLKGAARLEFHDAGARSLPLVSQLQRFIIGVNLDATKFRTGLLVATLGKGQVKVDDLRLVSPQLAVFAEGKYTPFTHRVDMEITASTAEGTARNVGRRILVNRLSVITPVTAALANVNELIADRVVQIHVGGTLRSPHFTLRPCPTLQQEVVRFFVRQLTAEVVDLDF